MTNLALSNCDQAAIEQYLLVVGTPHERAAIFCAICSHRIVFTDGEWRAGT